MAPWDHIMPCVRIKTPPAMCDKTLFAARMRAALAAKSGGNWEKWKRLIRLDGTIATVAAKDKEAK